MTDFFSIVVQVGLQLVVVAGVLIAATQYIDAFTRKTQKRDELRNRILQSIQGNKKIGVFKQHIEDQMILVKKNYQPGIFYYRFVFISVGFAIATMIIIYVALQQMPLQLSNDPFAPAKEVLNQNGAASTEWLVSVIIGLVALVLPYLRLRYQYAIAYARASYDLLEPTKLIAKFAHLSVDKALLETAKSMSDENVLKHAVRRLSSSFTTYRDEKELLQATRQFSGLVGTTFVNQFVNNLVYAERQGGQQMKKDFQSLNQAMEEQRETIMEVKANGRDAVQLGTYVNAVVILALCGTMVYLLKPSIYMKFQFGTSIGVAFFTALLISYLLSVFLSIILSRPKLDY